MNLNLSSGKHQKAMDFPHFPSRQQAFIWRNWGMAPVERLAKVLATTEGNVLDLAEAMGLDTQPDIISRWLERGYITIIRNNWHLLPYEQLLELLCWTPERLAYTLKEDDFLWIKLGCFKPAVEKLTYRPPTESEMQRTREIRNLLRERFKSLCGKSTENPFDFLKGFKPGKKVALNPCLEGRDKDSIRLDGTWHVELKALSDRTVKFAEKFKNDYEELWGLHLPLQEYQHDKKAIRLKVEPNPDLLSESYTVDVSENEIVITSVDDVGLLRGLQSICRQTRINAGPFLKKGMSKHKTIFDLRMIYSYFAVYVDSIMDPELDPYPDWYLERLSAIGINAIWLQGILYKLVPFCFSPEMSEGWKKRTDGLRRLARRAADYGISLYLYLNEPRSMPNKFFESHPRLKGIVEGDFSALCTSRQEVKEYLSEGIKMLFTEVPELAGLFTITMSENLTNCYSHAYPSKGRLQCERCGKRLPQEVVAEVNRIIYEAARSVKPDARVISWTWGWRPEWAEKAIAMLPDGMEIMCTSEEAMPISMQGIKGEVSDYSMSIVGPGEKAAGYWDAARDHKMKTIAKVQLNNTWECSAVPYLPVINLVEEHLKNLKKAGVNGLLLSWTLGGYPSLNLELASSYFWDVTREGNDMPEDIFAGLFSGEAREYVKKAFEIFSEAFKDFPFSIGVLYNAPQNFGPMNLLFEKPTGFNATMIGYPYDDINGWRDIYPEDVFEDQFARLSARWRSGLDVLNKAAEKGVDCDSVYEDILNISHAVYCHFRSAYLQVAFIRMRNKLEASADETERRSIAGHIIKILDEETDMAEKLYTLVGEDSRIGFEASNHYFYTKQNLAEKVINCDYLKRQYMKYMYIH